jgi:hypothetical protein
MLWNSSSQTAVDTWQAELEFALEAGDTPLLQVGGNQQTLAGLTSANALEILAEQRSDLVCPVILIGGASSVWLAALFQSSPANAHVATSTVLFAGVDGSTRIASSASAANARSRLRRSPGDAPTGFVELLLPDAFPGAPFGWDALAPSIVAMGVLPSEIQAANQPVASHADWLAWLGTGITLALLAVTLLAGALLNAVPSA